MRWKTAGLTARLGLRVAAPAADPPRDPEAVAQRRERAQARAEAHEDAKVAHRAHDADDELPISQRNQKRRKAAGEGTCPSVGVAHRK